MWIVNILSGLHNFKGAFDGQRWVLRLGLEPGLDIQLQWLKLE